jgi:hypothetical protein
LTHDFIYNTIFCKLLQFFVSSDINCFFFFNIVF